MNPGSMPFIVQHTDMLLHSIAFTIWSCSPVTVALCSRQLLLLVMYKLEGL
jgi:hypothetical protein